MYVLYLLLTVNPVANYQCNVILKSAKPVFLELATLYVYACMWRPGDNRQISD